MKTLMVKHLSSDYSDDLFTDVLERERKFALGLNAVQNFTTKQIAVRIVTSFGEHGAENIARAILNK